MTDKYELTDETRGGLTRMAARRFDPQVLWIPGAPTAILLVAISTSLFLLAAVIVLAVWLATVMDQRDNAAANWADEVFRVAGLRHDNARLAGDYDAVVKRLVEVLDEHALCPVPAEPADMTRFTERMVGVARAASVIPLQRDGGDS